MRTSFHHQPEAQHPHSPAINTPAGRLPHLLPPKETLPSGLGCPLCANSRNYLTHSITSSARVSSCGGTVRPSALAVLRLMTKSYLIGCWTGRSEGLAPFKILST